MRSRQHSLSPPPPPPPPPAPTPWYSRKKERRKQVGLGQVCVLRVGMRAWSGYEFCENMIPLIPSRLAPISLPRSAGTQIPLSVSRGVGRGAGRLPMLVHRMCRDRGALIKSCCFFSSVAGTGGVVEGGPACRKQGAMKNTARNCRQAVISVAAKIVGYWIFRCSSTSACVPYRVRSFLSALSSLCLCWDLGPRP